jgi:uncharacterized protein YecT (DUF1311 family)
MRALLSITPFVLAALLQAEDHPIDRAAQVCLDKATTAPAMAQCADTAIAAWNEEIRTNVDALATLLDPAGKQALKASQAEWERFRDAELKSIAAILSRLKGALPVVMTAEERMSFVRTRALDLKKYLDLLNGSPE